MREAEEAVRGLRRVRGGEEGADQARGAEKQRGLAAAAACAAGPGPRDARGGARAEAAVPRVLLGLGPVYGGLRVHGLHEPRAAPGAPRRGVRRVRGEAPAHAEPPGEVFSRVPGAEAQAARPREARALCG